MIRIRINDNDIIQYTDKAYSCNKRNRHHSLIKSFILNNGEIQFIESELEAKKIPDKHMECFTNIPFKKIITDSKHSLLFQDPNNTLRLLVYSDGYIQSVNFDDITEDDDIVVFDDNEGEWAITGIQEIKTYNTKFENEQIYNDADHMELVIAMFQGLSKTLSQYMIKLDSGMIINNIFVI